VHDVRSLRASDNVLIRNFVILVVSSRSHPPAKEIHPEERAQYITVLYDERLVKRIAIEIALTGVNSR